MPKNAGRNKRNYNNVVFVNRLRRIIVINSLSYTEFAKKINATRQSVGKWTDGTVLPTMEMLFKICECYNISADYLLGLSDVSTYDTSMISASKYTGLSEKAINAIKSLTEEDKAKINRLFENEKFLKLVTILSDSEVF